MWVFAVLRNAADSANPRPGASIYGAVQQLQLAARAYGIGSTLTTFHATHEAELRALLGLPDDALSMALVPLGYPARGRWTQPRRKPVEQVVHWNQWERPGRTADHGGTIGQECGATGARQPSSGATR